VSSPASTVPMSESAKRSGVPAPRPAVILVVDDDASVLSASGRILAMYGYAVLEALGGEQALQLARENAPNIDVVLTDVRMPGLDGPSLVRALADMLPTLRVVYMSGYADGRLDQELPAAGRAFLAKPFTVEQLTRTLADILA
jgi:two-component system cell cycle sensor histidine kinase/response regulator CckA